MRSAIRQFLTHLLSVFIAASMITASLGSVANARFISPDDWDPVHPGVGTNRYAYAGNDPVNKSDANGHQVEKAGTAATGGFLGWLESIFGGSTSRTAATGLVGGPIAVGVVATIQVLSPSTLGNGDRCAGGCTLQDAKSVETTGVAGPTDGSEEDQEKPSLLDPKADQHILEGDGPGKGGGHRAGAGKSGKSEFPSTWSDDKIRGEISDVATAPDSVRTPAGGGRTKVEGTRDGIDITVIVEPANRGGRIVTGFPTNTPRNP